MATKKWIATALAVCGLACGVAQAQTMKIGYLPSTVGQALTQAWKTGIENTLKGQNVSFQALDAQMKAEIQVTMMDDFINQGYNAIILQPIDAAALTASVKKAEGKGIPVITLNTDTKLPHAACVTMDDEGAGYLVGEQIGKALSGKGNVAIIQSPPGAQAGVEREKGFRAAMAKLFPEIKIVGAQNGQWNKDKAIEIMNSFLQVNKDLDAVFAVNDNMAEGAMIAAESAGRLNKVKIWGFNGQKSTLTLIEQGKITGTAYTNAYNQGATAAKYALDMLSGAKKKGDKTEIVTVPPFAATKDTVAQIKPEERW
ncbi:sugar ABC transporter substrate-binding protein [Propionivibrio soli]|uniref:sugar ABC transporter substrate-binding protein n=1 Tax=Propionivibrio soli TaxID=2976531 RepID=UPI0021E73CDC|nr:sugar ABC transporter substrate-binding protein [Propionivibrio soli]